MFALFEMSIGDRVKTLYNLFNTLGWFPHYDARQDALLLSMY
jgi:hypothetical protein